MQSTLVAAYNVILKSVALLVKSSAEDGDVRSAVKKSFRVFATESPEYIQAHDGKLAGLEWDAVFAALDGPEDAARADAHRATLGLLYDLHSEGASTTVSKPIVAALSAGGDVDATAESLHGLMLDPALVQRVAACADSLDESVRQALASAGLASSKGASGIMDIAQDISGSLDIEALMKAGAGGAGGGDAMTALLGKVTADITGRMERGDIDREKLMAEATGMLGMMQSGGLAQMVQGLMGAGQFGGAADPTPEECAAAGAAAAAAVENAPKKAAPAPKKGGSAKKKRTKA